MKIQVTGIGIAPKELLVRKSPEAPKIIEAINLGSCQNKIVRPFFEDTQFGHKTRRNLSETELETSFLIASVYHERRFQRKYKWH